MSSLKQHSQGLEELTEPASPTVSIIICCFNASRTIERTISSLLAQSFWDIEVVAIDDGSQDDTKAILLSLAGCDPRVRLLENPDNRGTAYTRQRGLDEARADLVMFVDADDIAEPELVSRLHGTLTSDPNLMGVGCYTTYFIEEGKDIGQQRVGPKSKAEFKKIYSEAKLLFMVPVTLFRKADALKVGGYRQHVMPNVSGVRYQDFAEDLDLWCRMSDLGAQERYFLTLPESLLRYRKPLDSLSTRNLSYMQLKMRWIKDCLRRRRSGLPERSLADFIASRSAKDRIADWRSDSAAAFYKKAGFCYARGNFIALAWYLFLTGIFSPKLIYQKVGTQKVSR